VAAALHAEPKCSQEALLKRFRQNLPDVYGKAYRWVAEMEEIARFAVEDPGAAEIYQGAARLYERLAADAAGALARSASWRAFSAGADTAGAQFTS